jgi:hypothetical protein
MTFEIISAVLLILLIFHIIYSNKIRDKLIEDNKEISINYLDAKRELSKYVSYYESMKHNSENPKITGLDFMEYYKEDLGKYKASPTFWIKIAEPNTPKEEAYSIYLKNHREIDKNFDYMDGLLKSGDGGWR